MRHTLRTTDMKMDKTAFALLLANVFAGGMVAGIVAAWIVSALYIWPNF